MTQVYGVSGEELKRYIDRLMKLEEEKAEIAGHIRDVFAEAKSSGFDVKAMRQIMKEMKMDKHDLDEQETLLMTYKRALGLLPELD